MTWTRASKRAHLTRLRTRLFASAFCLPETKIHDKELKRTTIRRMKSSHILLEDAVLGSHSGNRSDFCTIHVLPSRDLQAMNVHNELVCTKCKKRCTFCSEKTAQQSDTPSLVDGLQAWVASLKILEPQETTGPERTPTSRQNGRRQKGLDWGVGQPSRSRNGWVSWSLRRRQIKFHRQKTQNDATRENPTIKFRRRRRKVRARSRRDEPGSRAALWRARARMVQTACNSGLCRCDHKIKDAPKQLRHLPQSKRS